MNWYAFTESEQAALRAGGVVAIGRHRYRLCPKCGKIVCLTKMFLGSVHVCSNPEIPGA